MNWYARLRLLCALAVCALALPVPPADAGVSIYHDRATFNAALAATQAVVRTDDFESYALGPIALGSSRGDFRYDFDPLVLQPAIVPGGFGGQALGGDPFDVFVGDDSVSLTFQPPSPPGGPFLYAFGADFLYAPSFDTIPADTYRIAIADGTAAGQFAGNLDSIDPAGGAFFLGLIADPGSAFKSVNLLSVQVDPAFLVPAYQVDDLIYAAVPEPSTFTLLSIGGLVLVAGRRRRR